MRDLHQLGAADVGGALAHGLQRRGRVVAAEAPHAHHPARHTVGARFLGNHDRGSRLFVGDGAEASPPSPGRADGAAVAAAEVGAGVADADVHTLLAAGHRSPSPAAARGVIRGQVVHHQHGGQFVDHCPSGLRRAATTRRAHGAAARTCTPVTMCTPGRASAAPHLGLDRQAARGQRRQAGVAVGVALPAGLEGHVGLQVAEQAALVDQRLREAGKQLLQHLPAAGQQAMRVNRLRRALRGAAASGSTSRSSSTTSRQCSLSTRAASSSREAGAEHDGTGGGRPGALARRRLGRHGAGLRRSWKTGVRGAGRAGCSRPAR
ncbi:MAG: hypothetical protein U1F56_09495 [Rubrivivax sp.]